MKNGGGRLPRKRKGCSAHLHMDQELLRAALCFVRVPRKKMGAAAFYATPYALF
jgi:hypothetical protein